MKRQQFEAKIDNSKIDCSTSADDVNIVIHHAAPTDLHINQPSVQQEVQLFCTFHYARLFVDS